MSTTVNRFSPSSVLSSRKSGSIDVFVSFNIKPSPEVVILKATQTHSEFLTSTTKLRGPASTAGRSPPLNYDRWKPPSNVFKINTMLHGNQTLFVMVWLLLFTIFQDNFWMVCACTSLAHLVTVAEALALTLVCSFMCRVTSLFSNRCENVKSDALSLTDAILNPLWLWVFVFSPKLLKM